MYYGVRRTPDDKDSPIRIERTRELKRQTVFQGNDLLLRHGYGQSAVVAGCSGSAPS